MDFVEKIWNDPSFSVATFSKELGYSKSQLYRKLMSITGKSANVFMKEFRLHRALNLMHLQKGIFLKLHLKLVLTVPHTFPNAFTKSMESFPQNIYSNI